MARLLLFLILPALLPGQNVNTIVRFEHYTVNDGLSHNHVFQSFTDSRGILWIVTDAGLNRFDGRTFKLISEVKLVHPPSAKILLEDRENELWISGPKDPLRCLNIYTEEVRTGREKFGSSFPGKIVSAIHGAAGSYVLRTTNDSIMRYTPGKGLVPVYSKPGEWIKPIAESETGTLWIEYRRTGKSGQMLAYNPAWPQPRVFDYTSPLTQTREVLPDGGIAYTNPDSFFIAKENGLERACALRTMLPHYRFENGFNTGRFQHILAMPGGTQFLFSTPDDLVLLDAQLQVVYDFKLLHGELLSHQIYNLNLDHQGLIWMSTFNGLYKIQFTVNAFRNYLKAGDPAGAGTLQSCRGIEKAGDGNIYAAANGGVYRLFGEVEKAVFYRPIGKGRVYSMCADPSNNLWFRAVRKLYRYNTLNGSLKTFALEDPRAESNGWSIRSIGALVWMADPLAWFDPADGTYHILKDFGAFPDYRSANTFQILPAGGERYWLVSSNGLYLFDPVEKRLLERYWSGGKGKYYLPVDDLRHFYPDPDGTWWFATSEGVLHADPLHGAHRLFTRAEGLSHNMCYAVIPDAFGFLWISSDYGLMQFEKSTGRVKAYFAQDGLDMNEFNRISHFQDADGTLYFGGIGGVVALHPKDFVRTFHDLSGARVVMTDCMVFSGKTAQEEDARPDFYHDNELRIDPRDRYVQISFALMDYREPGRITYFYKIKGYREDWQVMEGNNLRLAALPYGKHNLLVKARNADGTESPQELSILLNVLRPFYLKPWFGIMLMAATLCVLIFYSSRRVSVSIEQSAPSPAETAVPETLLISEPTTIWEPETDLPAPAALKPEDVRFVENLERTVLNHLDDLSFDANALCKAAGLSHSHLHRRLSALTGLSVGRYIHSIRLKEAMQRILHTNLTIAEIAYQTGFSDPAYFTRLFTKMYQHPPSSFREGR